MASAEEVCVEESLEEEEEELDSRLVRVTYLVTKRSCLLVIAREPGSDARRRLFGFENAPRHIPWNNRIVRLNRAQIDPMWD